MTTLATLQPYLLHPDVVTRQALEHVLAVLRVAAPFVAVALSAMLVSVIALYVVGRVEALRLSRGGRFIAILAPPEVDAAGAAVLWSTLVALLRPWYLRVLGRQPHVSFEFHWSDGGLQLGMWVPRTVPPGMVERAVEAAWPGCTTVASASMPSFPVDAVVSGGVLRLARPEWLPIESSFEVEPLRPLLASCGYLDAGQSAAVQVVARPVTGRRVARLFRAAEAMRRGRSMGRLARLLDVVHPRRAARPSGGIDLVAAQDARLILSKAGAPLYEVLVRYAAWSPDRGRRARRSVRGRAGGLAAGFAVFTGRNGFKRHRLRRPAVELARRGLHRGDVLSVNELAAIAHLPSDRAVPGLARARARRVIPVPAVMSTGKPLGETDAGAVRQVALDVEDARYHVHIIGATGTGKSTLLTNLILGDIEAGRGVVAIDPKGDLITDLLERMPRDAADRLSLLDPDDEAAMPTLNVLDGEDADLVVDNLVGIFHRIFESFWGPRTDDVLRAACLTLLKGKKQAKLAEVPELLTDAAFREEHTAGVTDPVLRGFWTWYASLGEAQQAQLVGPLMNKLRAFLLRRTVRQLIGSYHSSLDMAAILDGGICLARVPKGILGEETSRLLGSFLVAAVWQAVTARARKGQQARVDAALYLDECQNFLTLPRSLDEMLAEARGYRLSLVLAHQHLAQLPVSLREAISANARSKLLFTVSPEDARALERHVAPDLAAHDLAHLDGYQLAARLVVAGREQPAFTLRTRPAPPAQPGRVTAIREIARGRRQTQRQREHERTETERLPAGRRPPGEGAVA